MSNSTTNGRVQRKSLASQLDRLDNTIDALADGLNKAVADAVREAVAEAIETVVRQVLSNPELLRQLAGQLTPPPPARVSPQTPKARPGGIIRALRWLGSRVGHGWPWVRDGV
jgi:hypothetical protein